MSARITTIFLVIVTIIVGFFVYPKAWDAVSRTVETRLNVSLPAIVNIPFQLGLDLQGGTQLVYEGDTRTVQGDVGEAMAGVRDVVERRVNLFGVSEPNVQVAGESRLIVELAGVHDVNQAIALIGETPLLEFREERSAEDQAAILAAQQQGQRLNEDPYFSPTPLTGEYLKRSQVVFAQQGLTVPEVQLVFNDEGKQIFAELTKRNVGRRIAIYLDGVPISAPTVENEITEGEAVIQGNFAIDEAQLLVTRLNAGALPVPITLVSQQTIGPSLGAQSLSDSLRAGLYGLIAVALFMIIYYRLQGFSAVLALIVYSIIVLAIYKVIPVTLTLAGIAGFILSLGMAVDANVLIFSRIREELRKGLALNAAIERGFQRAWSSIWDSQFTTLLAAIILYAFTTSLVQGFALTLIIGVAISLFTATFVTKNFLKTIVGTWADKHRWLL